GLGLGLAARLLHQRMDHRIVNLTTPFARYLGCRLIRTRQRGRESQFLLQYRAHPLVCPQSPPLPNRTTPMLILRVLAVLYHQLYPTDDGAQTHCLLSPVMWFPIAEGGKLRLGGWLLPGVSAPAVGASIRALLPKLPSLSRAESAADCSPRSLVLSSG